MNPVYFLAYLGITENHVEDIGKSIGCLYVALLSIGAIIGVALWKLGAFILAHLRWS